MLRQASVPDLRSGAVSRRDGHVVVVMRFYPRGVAREVLDEYVRALAPDEVLFREFKAADRAYANHERAFVKVSYEKRFRLGPEGMTELRRLVELSRTKDVFLVCQCEVGESCHRELLLILAREKLGAKVDRGLRRYPVFEARIDEAAG